ncbi:MAG: methane monooxygenase/ammonia monooxygenase subunit B, partial [Thermodesulfobacteriota bacterium]
MDRRFLVGLVTVALVAIAGVPQVLAHGEAGDEPFLKDLTVAFYDVSISPTEIEVGQPVTVIGKVKILETWPHTLYPPEIASIVPVVPGPVFAL